MGIEEIVVTKGISTLLLLIIAAGVGYFAFSEFQKRQFASDVSDNMRKQIVGEGIRFSVVHRNEVADYYWENEAFPITAYQLESFASQSVRPYGILGIDLREGGQVSVSLSASALGLSYSDGEPVLLFTPEDNDGVLSWKCEGAGALAGNVDLLPSACRTH